MKNEYFEVKRNIKNYPWKVGEFLNGYVLADSYVLGGYNVGSFTKKELIKSGVIVRISKKELTRILIGRNVVK